jgi:hypothetical protein
MDEMGMHVGVIGVKPCPALTTRCDNVQGVSGPPKILNCTPELIETACTGRPIQNTDLTATAPVLG